MAELGAGSGTGYPSAIDSDATTETASDYVRIQVPNDLAAAIVAIETELGTLPKGSEASVKVRLNKVAKVLDRQTTAVGNVGAGEDTLMTYSLPASTLGTDGDSIRVTAWGTMAANVNNKRLRAYFGATALVDVSAAINDAVWKVECIVTRTAAATQDGVGEYRDDIPNGEMTISSPAETLSGAVVVKVTGEAVADNDIVCEGWMVELLPAP